MLVQNCSFRDFHERLQGKKCVIFGCGKSFDNLLRRREYVIDDIKYCIDNKKFGQKLYIKDKIFAVYPVKKILDELPENTAVLICSSIFYDSMYNELSQYYQLEKMECYFADFMYANDHRQTENLVSEYIGKEKIPKIIHCFWFSKEAKPALQRQCIESWKKHCPDYEIKEWNIDNYDISGNSFVSQAIARKKWAFASDYARLDVIYQYGGIYFDLDVELIKNIDFFLDNKAFFGFDCTDHIELGSGFGAVPKHPLIKQLLETYKNKEFINIDGSINDTPQPVIITPVFEENGFVRNGERQSRDGITIFESDFLSPIDFILFEKNITNNTCCIHYFDDAWHTDEQCNKKRIAQKNAEKWKEIIYKM